MTAWRPLLVLVLIGSLPGIATAQSQRPARDDDPVLQVGRTLESTIREPWERSAFEEPHRLVRLIAGVSGWVTVEAESDAFDVAVSVYDEEARDQFRGDEDSGPGPAAQLSFLAEADTRYRVRVLAQDGLGGAFRLTASAGRADALPEEDEELQRAHFYVAAAQLAEADSRVLHARDCWFKAGALFMRRGLSEQALGPLERTRELALSEGAHPIEITAGLLLARCRASLWELDAAARGLREVVAEAQRHGLPEFAFEAQLMLAAVQEDLGRPDELLATLLELRAAADEGGLVFQRARCNGRIAIALQELGDVRGALDAHRASLRETRERTDWTPDEVAELLWLAGRVRGARGEPDIAERFLVEALESSARSDVQLRILGELALAAQSRGAWAPARRWLQSFDQLLAGTPGLDADSSGVLWTRATFAARDGDAQAARALYERLLDGLAEDAVALRVEALLSLATVLDSTGETAAAAARLEDALALAEGADLARLAGTAQGALGRTLARDGLLTEAVESHRAALASARERLDDVAVAAALADLGRVLWEVGQSAEAKPLLNEAVDILVEAGHHAQALDPLEVLVRAAWAAGDNGTMADHLRQAEASCDALTPSPAHALDAPLPMSRWAAWAMELSMARLERAEPGSDEAAAVVVDGFAAASRWKERAVFEGVSGAQPAVDASALLPVLSAALGPGHVLVDYVEGVDRLYAWVLRDGALRLLVLGDRVTLLREAAAFTEGVSGDTGLLDVSAILRDGDALFDHLLASALSAGAEEPVTDLTVVPSAGLARLPFEALVVGVAETAGDETGDSAADGALSAGAEDPVYLADVMRVTYASSTRALADLLRREGPARAQSGTLMLAEPGRVSGRDPARSSMALLPEDASPGGLASLTDLLAMHVDAGVVVLPGVRDAAGPVVRGLGLASLSQAFLNAGARAVVVSRWPTGARDADLVSALTTTRADTRLPLSAALQTARHAVRRGDGEVTVTLSDGRTQTVPVSHPHVWARLVLMGDGR